MRQSVFDTHATSKGDVSKDYSILNSAFDEAQIQADLVATAHRLLRGYAQLQAELLSLLLLQSFDAPLLGTHCSFFVLSQTTGPSSWYEREAPTGVEMIIDMLVEEILAISDHLDAVFAPNKADPPAMRESVCTLCEVPLPFSHDRQQPLLVREVVLDWRLVGDTLARSS